MIWRDCTACKVPIASGQCEHVEQLEGRVVMSLHQWEKLLTDTEELRRHKADAETPEMPALWD